MTMQAPPAPIAGTITIHDHRVACDGGGTLGHPRVFLEMGPDHRATCPYCGREFRLAEDAHAGFLKSGHGSH